MSKVSDVQHPSGHQSYHCPVMLDEVVDLFGALKDGTVVDATFGGGGHTRALLERLGPDVSVLGIDRDPTAIAGAAQHDRLRLVLGNFGALDAITRAQLQSWLAETWNRIGGSALLVTHDPHEAVALSDRVYVMSPRPGRITNVLEVDLPRPRTARAAETAAAHRLIDALRRQTEAIE